VTKSQQKYAASWRIFTQTNPRTKEGLSLFEQPKIQFNGTASRNPPSLRAPRGLEIPDRHALQNARAPTQSKAARRIRANENINHLPSVSKINDKSLTQGGGGGVLSLALNRK
jgi:hypothetical protein